MLLALPCLAHAAGMGKLTILSALGWPLQAEIDLISVQENELSSLRARIAPPEAYTKANIQYSPALIGVRLSIERRSDGQPYIKIISTRPVNEPFIDLLVELSWAQGLLVREYTALIDPPGYTPGAPIVQAAPPVEQATVVTPAEPQALAPAAPVEAKPAAKAPPVTRPAAAPARTIESQARAPAAPGKAKPAARAPVAARPAAAPARAESKEYGPVQPGDTLSRIAARVKPEGVTLEQTLASLYKANREAFGDSMDVLYVGSVLRIPEELQAATPAQSKAAAGKEPPIDVLRLSTGELADSGKAGNDKASRQVTERLRKLEAEVDALEKALTDANKLVVQLEQTVKTMRRQIAITEQMSGGSDTGTLPQSAPGAKPGAAPPMKGDQVAQPAPAKAESAGQATAQTPVTGEQAAPAAQPAAAGPAQSEAQKHEAPKAAVVATIKPKPKPPETVQAPPDLIDQILEEPLYLAGGGILVLLGVGWLARRRRKSVVPGDLFDMTAAPRVATSEPHVATAEPRVAMPEPHVANVNPTAVKTDPLVEANLFLSFGRDERAEEILIEVLEENPAHEEAELKLLQIYAKRKDKDAFGKIAQKLHARTSGGGENWLKTAAMGYAFDPGNPLYGASRSASATTMPAPSETATAAGADIKSPPPAPAVTVTEPTKIKADVVNNNPQAAQLNSKAAAVEAQDTTRDAGAAPAAPAAAPAIADLGIALEFPSTTKTPPAAPDKTPGASAADAVKTDAKDGPAVAFPEITLDFPSATQPSATPAETPAAPEVEAIKTVVPDEPPAPMIGTIDFESKTSAPATRGEDSKKK